eukprot:scaffold38028_cov191-Amphora_coffeaeformis.AAC.1
MKKNLLRKRFLARLVAACLFGMSAVNFVRRLGDITSSSSSSGTTSTIVQNPPIKTDLRVLYIVTSLSAYDTGKRSTTAGDDRFAHTLVPVVGESATNMAQQFTHVDVYLICHYELNHTAQQMLRDALPANVDLQVWQDATPLGYASEDIQAGISLAERKLTPITRALARQHRYVIKDYIESYDLFVNFEDDMLLHGSQVQAYLDLTQELYDLRQAAPTSVPESPSVLPLERFYGPLTKIMLSRMLPGWIRVEHAPTPPTKQHRFEQVPVTLEWPRDDSSTSSSLSWLRRRTTTTTHTISLDPAPCCSVKHTTPHITALQPRIQELYLWETSLQALGIREMPAKLGWVVMQTGNNDAYMNDLTNFAIGEYWTGRAGYFDQSVIVEERLDRTLGDYMNNQGGWMATRRQILEWNRMWCRGSLIPPFDAPTFVDDGLSKITVEYWSGGFQLAGARACNLQRIIPLEPERFAQFLLYHTSNNKQRQKFVRHRFYGRHVQDFWGQLNTIRLHAVRRKAQEGG